MEILYPLVISAIAVLVTLTYASYLDIRDRRVPLCIGCRCWVLALSVLYTSCGRRLPI